MKLVYDSEEYQPPRSGLILLQCAIGLLFMVFCARFWFLQIHRGGGLWRARHRAICFAGDDFRLAR